jgi:hypothetical protein
LAEFKRVFVGLSPNATPRRTTEDAIGGLALRENRLTHLAVGNCPPAAKPGQELPLVK